MEDETSDLPADEFKRLGQNMDDKNDTKTFHSSSNSNLNYSDYQNNERKGVSKLLLIVLVVVVLGLIGGTGFLLRDKFAPSQKAEASPSPSVVAEVTPAPTPQSLDRSQFKIRILNGTKTSGLAASVSAKLKDLGYQIDKTGNATNSAFEQTQVRAKDSANGLIDQLIKDLSPDYQAASSSGLKSSDTADGEVIIGTK